VKGSIHFHEPARRYFVQVYWQGKKERFWKYNGEPLLHEKTATKLLSKIQVDIDSGTFNPKTYRPDSPLSLKIYKDLWLDASTACKNTKKVYRSCFERHIIPYFTTDFDIRNFTHSKLSIFYNQLPLSTKGKYNVLTCLKSMLNFAVKDEAIAKVPPFPSLSQGLPKEIAYLTQDQQESVLEAIPGKHRAIFALMMEYGLRPGEARAIKKDCITPYELIIKRSFSEYTLRETTKTGRVRRYGLTTNAREILKANPGNLTEFVFVHNGRSPYDSKVLNKIWREASKQAGFEIKLYNAVRHSLGCQLLDEGQELELVRDILGHTKTDMTRRYAQRAPQKITNVLEGRHTKVIPLRREAK